MIARTWKGWTREGDADAYVGYLLRTGLTEYGRTPGNRGSLTLRRLRDGEAEFLVVSLWDSLEAVRAFTGQSPERAIFYPEDDRYLVRKEDTVEHFEIVAGQAWMAGGAGPLARLRTLPAWLVSAWARGWAAYLGSIDEPPPGERRLIRGEMLARLR